VVQDLLLVMLYVCFDPAERKVLQLPGDPTMFRQSRLRRAPLTNWPHARKLFFEPLEDRRLLAGDSAAFTPLVSHTSSDAEFATQARSSVVVFVDSAVAGYQGLIQDLVRPTEASAADVEVVILDGDRDGIAQMSETLSRYADVSTIHVLSHGSSGSLQLGNTQLTGSNLDSYAAQLSAWQESLAEGADILLYGCNVAEGKGMEFVADLAGATGADVAASDNLTGAAMLGGDWILETSTGAIQGRVLTATGEYPGVLYDVCSDDGRCTHEEMAAYAYALYMAKGGSLELDGLAVMEGAGHEDEVDHIYDMHSVPIIPMVTITHFWDADAGPYAPSHVDGPGFDVLFPSGFPNSWQKAEQYWSLALGAYADGNKDLAYEFLGHIAHQMGDNTIPTHVHVSAHDPVSGDDSVEDWMSQGPPPEAPGIGAGSDLLPGEMDTLISQGLLDITDIPGRTRTPLGKLYWLMYTTNQIADFFPSDREEGDTFDPEGWVTTELSDMAATIARPRTSEDLADNDCSIPAIIPPFCLGGLPGDDDNNRDGDLGVIRQHSYLRGIRAIASLYELFEQTVKEPIAYVKIETVQELDDHDYACAPNPIPFLPDICVEITEADFYAQVSVAGLVAQNIGDKQTPDDEVIHPNWTFGQTVGTSGSVPMWIEIWDEDDFLAGADDQSNITAGDGRRLDFSVDLAACLSGAGGAVSGGNINGGGGACAQSLTSNVSADDDDDVDGIARVTFSVRMSNVPPTAEAGGPYTVDEGSNVVLSGAASSDPNQPANTLTYAWDIDNNGSFETAGINPTFSAAGLDGPSSRTVRLQVTDNGGLTDTDEATITIENVPADLQNVVVTPQLDENGVATLSGNIVDPGTPDTFTLVVNWGEGPSQTYSYPAGTTSFSETHRYLDDNPTVTLQDTYNITLNLSDDDSGTDPAAVSTLVKNVNPDLLNVVVTPELDENGFATLSGSIVDPGTQDTFTLVVDWGEGPAVTYSYAAGTTRFAETHQYLDDNPTGTPQDTYNISLTLSDDDSGSDSAAVSTLVKNVAPAIAAFTSDAVECGAKREGDTVHVTGAFIDVGTLDTHSATISWGDHTTTVATIAEAGGAGTIAGEHIYSSGGIFRIIVTLTDDDTGQTTERTFALITGVGVLDGQLQAVGTEEADAITVSRLGQGEFVVRASFIPNSSRKYPAEGVTSIAMILCRGDDQATIAGTIDLPTYITAEEGDDDIKGGGGPNVLLGGDGDDRVTGGSNHDILVGGDGIDRIVGNGGDDILIAGTLGGAADPIDQLDSLLALLIEWEQLRDRAKLRPKLIIGGDDDADMLTGSADADWFFFELGEDTATDLKQELAENLG
jgi:hypothetical protein